MTGRPTLRRGEDGATLVEFGFVGPILCLTIMGLFDLGYQMYVSSVVEGAVHQAARTATVGGVTGDRIEREVRDQLFVFSKDARIDVTQKSYQEFTDVRKPEKIVTDTVPLGQYNQGDCFEDANGNGSYDLDRGRDGFGNAEDIVDYEVSINYPRLFPMAGLLGWSQNAEVRRSTVLRNQPFAARTGGVKVIC